MKPWICQKNFFMVSYFYEIAEFIIITLLCFPGIYFPIKRTCINFYKLFNTLISSQWFKGKTVYCFWNKTLKTGRFLKKFQGHYIWGCSIITSRMGVGGSQGFSWCLVTENKGGEWYLMKDRNVTVKRNHKIKPYFVLLWRDWDFINIEH